MELGLPSSGARDSSGQRSDQRAVGTVSITSQRLGPHPGRLRAPDRAPQSSDMDGCDQPATATA